MNASAPSTKHTSLNTRVTIPGSLAGREGKLRPNGKMKHSTDTLSVSIYPFVSVCQAVLRCILWYICSSERRIVSAQMALQGQGGMHFLDQTNGSSISDDHTHNPSIGLYIFVTQGHAQEGESELNEQVRVRIEVRVDFLVSRNIRCCEDRLILTKMNIIV